MFNPKFTFESFVVGNNNRAHAAAKAVADAPGKSHSPLFISGGVGLGKTHLLHAIGNHVSSNNKDARIAFLSAEQFTSEFIDAILNNHPDQFREKHLRTDVFLIDDLQFLPIKERLQEEFFNTVNALREAHKQIVLACNCPLGKIPGLEQRLVSRFEWGLQLRSEHKEIVPLEQRLASCFEPGQTAELQVPDVATRLAILHKKAQWMDVPVPDDILNFLADHFRTDIRRLENALLHVASHAVLTGEKPTLEIIEGLFWEIPHE